MTTFEQFDAYTANRAALGRHYVDQERNYVHPFRLYGNVWYVGDNWVCTHLIDLSLIHI